MKIKAIIFDLDGVLINSEPVHYKIISTMLRRYGINQDAITDDVFGRRVIDNIDYFRRQYVVKKSTRQLYREWSAIAKKLSVQMKLMPGAIAALNRAKKENLKLCLATSTESNVLKWVFDNIPIKKYFDVIISGSMIKKGKPHPEIYRTALKKLKLKPSEAVVIEDSVHGISSAQRAGLKCIGLVGSFPAAKLKQADAVIKSLQEINLRLINRLSS
jgi:HAD superfamily hydrolase (TIGR01509 family)